MIIQGSINHTYSGRRRNFLKQSKKVQPVFRTPDKPLLSNSRAEEINKYPSAPLTKYRSPVDTSYKLAESKKHTVAIAYNKGGYMVISKENVRDIGK
jgi:hypothetical protein